MFRPPEQAPAEPAPPIDAAQQIRVMRQGFMTAVEAVTAAYRAGRDVWLKEALPPAQNEELNQATVDARRRLPQLIDIVSRAVEAARAERQAAEIDLAASQRPVPHSMANMIYARVGPLLDPIRDATAELAALKARIDALSKPTKPVRDPANQS